MGSIISKISDEIKLHGTFEAYLLFEQNKNAPATSPSGFTESKIYTIAPFRQGETINSAGDPCNVKEKNFWILVANQLKDLSRSTATDQVIELSVSKLQKYIEASKHPFMIGNLCFKIAHESKFDV